MSPCSSTSKISVCEVFKICRMHGPVVTFAVFPATHFDEALVERQVVSNSVPPTLVVVSVIWKVI